MLTKTNLVSLLAVITFALASSDSLALEKPKPDTNIVWSSISDFGAAEDTTKIWYVDEERACLAVDAVKFKERFAKVHNTFTGKAGNYKLLLTALTEIDGESDYRINVNDEAVAVMTNPESDLDFTEVIHDFGAVALVPGDIISVEFNAVTNGKIPEDGGTAYARGRWKSLSLTRLSTEKVQH